MLGVYVHVPFCLSKCHYCDFYSRPASGEERERYLDLVCQETEAAVRQVPEREVDTIFLGGGTPGLLGPEGIKKILQAIAGNFHIINTVEITMETNPGANRDIWPLMAAAGINRVSLGAQAAQERLLRVLGRCHTWREVQNTVQAARRAGLTNLNLDLMYGLPGQSLADWQETVAAALALEVPHLSLYALKVEENTPFDRWEREGRITLPEEEECAEMYWWAREKLETAGYLNYELSNFARPGFECRHNLKYWRRQPYLGLGPAAHSCWENVRWANPAGLEEWEAEVRARGWSGQLVERLGEKEILAEQVILGLRLAEGVVLTPEIEAEWSAVIASLKQRGLVQVSGNRLKLTRQAWYIANEVMAEFI